MTTEQWPEAIGLGPLYGPNPTDLRAEEAQRSPERRRMIPLAHSEALHDDAARKLYRDGAEVMGVNEIPAGYLSSILPHIKETGGRVPFARPAEPDDDERAGWAGILVEIDPTTGATLAPEEDHPEECGCPECREDADRDTADEHDYAHELWADADASREGEGL